MKLSKRKNDYCCCCCCCGCAAAAAAADYVYVGCADVDVDVESCKDPSSYSDSHSPVMTNLSRLMHS